MSTEQTPDQPVQQTQSNNESLEKLFQVLFNLGSQEQKQSTCPCPNTCSNKTEQESDEESDESDEETNDEWSALSSLLESHDKLCQAFLTMIEQKYEQ